MLLVILMKLKEFLERSSTADHGPWTKADVARKFKISPPAVSLWDEIPEKYVKRMQQILDEGFLPPKIVKPVELSDLELLEVIRTRGSVSDFDICRAHGWRIPEFNQMIADLTKKYPLNGESWKTHEFWGQVKGSCDS